MDCENLTDDILCDLADRKAAPDDRLRAEEHLEACLPCRQRFEEVREIAAALRRSLEAPSNPALLNELDRTVLHSLLTEWKSTADRRRWKWWALAGAAALVAAAAGLHSFRNPAPVPTAPVPILAATVVSLPPVVAPAPEPPALVVPAPEPAPMVALLPPEAPFRTVLVGDVNGDGRVDSADSLMLMEFVVLDGPVTDPAAADIDGDGRLDIGDVLALDQMIESAQ